MAGSPPPKRACVEPEADLVVRGTGPLAGLSSLTPGYAFRYVWSGVVSCVGILFVHAANATLAHANRWLLDGWVSTEISIVVLIRAGNSFFVGRIGSRELPIAPPPPDRYEMLPGGGRRLVRQNTRVICGVTFRKTLTGFMLSSLQKVSLEDIRMRLGDLDMVEQVPSPLACVLQPGFSMLWSDNAFQRSYPHLFSTHAMCQMRKHRNQQPRAMWPSLVGDCLAMDSLLDSYRADSVFRTRGEELTAVLDMIFARNAAVRSRLSREMMAGLFASLTVHLMRYSNGADNVRRMIDSLLAVLRVPERRLQQHCNESQFPRPATAFRDLREAMALRSRHEAARDQWPFAPGSMVAGAVPFEEMRELNLPGSFFVKGTVYLSPDAVRECRLSAHNLVETLLRELRAFAERCSDDEGDRENLENLAVPLDVAPRVKLDQAKIEAIFDSLTAESLRHDTRRELGKIMARGLPLEARAIYHEKIRELLAGSEKCESRMRELEGWIKWFSK